MLGATLLFFLRGFVVVVLAGGLFKHILNLAGNSSRVTGILNVLLPEYGNLPAYRLNPTFLSDLQRKLLNKDLSK